jgi:uncharacterized protein
VLVLLPPSEGKTVPTAGAPVRLDELNAPTLTTHRRRVLQTLVRTSARPDAAAVLGTGPTLADEVGRNTTLPEAPAAEARHVYTGVLYGAAGLGDLPEPALARAERSVRTISALWGLVTPVDRIPAYRLSMTTDLPGIGPLAASWRQPLAAVLDAEAAGRLVVDCRSTAYASAWRPRAGLTESVDVRVLREAEGRRTVVSHWAKHTRGVLARHLLVRDSPAPQSPRALLDAAGELVGRGLVDAELIAAPRGRHVLQLVVR